MNGITARQAARRVNADLVREALGLDPCEYGWADGRDEYPELMFMQRDETQAPTDYGTGRTCDRVVTITHADGTATTETHGASLNRYNVGPWCHSCDRAASWDEIDALTA